MPPYFYTLVKSVNPLFEAFSPLDITAYTFALPAAPFCADIHHTIDIEVILKKYHFLCQYCDILLVEGAGGLLVPMTQDFTMLDLIVKLSAPTLLITPSRLGCINDTLLSIQALKSRNVSFDWCVNLYEDQDSFSEVTQPYYDATFTQWWSVAKGLDRYVENLCYHTSS
ncbi:MAG: dethiobiotin synthase [Sulfurovum sp.]|nr:dethiobiotin synthase [Sulfurovum sp.]